MDYARGLQRARTKLGMSQGQLARKAKLDPSYVAHIEAGRRKPSLDVLEALASALELPMPVLMLYSAEQDDLNGISEGQAASLSEMLTMLVKAE